MEAATTRIIDKIVWRLRIAIESLPNLVPALILEPTQHPWRLICTRLLCSSSRYHNQLSRVPIRYQGSAWVSVVDCLYNTINAHEAAVEFLALVYPYKVRFPIAAAMIEGPYEIGPVRLEVGDYVIDAGANIGLFSLHALRRVGAGGKVYAFEPFPDAYTLLQRNLAGYNDCDNVFLVPVALGSSSGQLRLSVGGLADASGVMSRSETQVTVPVTTIDDFVAENQLPKVDFIKMDIEGMERKALQGAKETLRRFKPRLAICTYHLPDDRDVIPRVITEIVPEYRITQKRMKLYAWCPREV